jgi:hypothetical protein
MSVTTVAKFVTTIAHAIFAFKRYPTSLDFTLIAIQIITKYPFLKGITGNGHVRNLQSILDPIDL